MDSKKISEISIFVQDKMKGESTGHDWYHVERVFKIATKIARKEKNIDMFVVQAAALLHDIGDWKVKTTTKSEEQILDETFAALELEDVTKQKVKEIILNMSYSKNISGKNKLSLEGQIVQDADRLEALGAIGIARAFAYGGKKDRPIYDPEEKPQEFQSTEEYRKSQGHTINHFYEKLFKLKKLLNTTSAKKIATKREKFMKDFLKEFYAEWDGKA